MQYTLFNLVRENIFINILSSLHMLKRWYRNHSHGSPYGSGFDSAKTGHAVIKLKYTGSISQARFW
jgi:hypothetical protein